MSSSTASKVVGTLFQQELYWGGGSYLLDVGSVCALAQAFKTKAGKKLSRKVSGVFGRRVF